MTRLHRLRFAALITVIGLAVAAAQPALADDGSTTPSLTGEHLAGRLVHWTDHCLADGTGALTFYATGEATGPYPGKFREWGTVFVTRSGGTLYENFNAAFEIRSTTPVAVIRGTKSEIPPETFTPIACQGYIQFSYSSYTNDFPNVYRASVRRAGNDFSDHGTSNSEVNFACSPMFPECPPKTMREDFISARGLTLSENTDSSAFN